MSVHDIFQSRRDVSEDDPLHRQFRASLIECIANLEMTQCAFRKLRKTKPSAELDRLDSNISELHAQLTEMFGSKYPTRSELVEIQCKVRDIMQSCDPDGVALAEADKTMRSSAGGAR